MFLKFDFQITLGVTPGLNLIVLCFFLAVKGLSPGSYYILAVKASFPLGDIN